VAAQPVQVAVYRIVQEALTNVVRHADAQRADVRLASADGGVTLAVADDGRGVNGDPSANSGLLGMRERITELGGRLRVRTAPGEGFHIEAWLPATARS
jgi:signal transduction histidine kinase